MLPVDAGKRRCGVSIGSGGVSIGVSFASFVSVGGGGVGRVEVEVGGVGGVAAVAGVAGVAGICGNGNDSMSPDLMLRA